MTTVKRKSKQLGQILIELGYITPEQLDVALEEHRKTPKSLGRVLIDLGMIKEADLVRALAEQVGLEFVDLTEFPIDSTATVAAARGARAPVPGPADRGARREAAGRDVGPGERLRARRHPHDHRPRRQPVVATANDVEAAIQKYAGMDSQVEAMASIVAERSEERRRRATSRPRSRTRRSSSS